MDQTSEIEKTASASLTDHIEQKPSYDRDDIHQAALIDNPDKAEHPNWSTLLSIVFLAMAVVGPLSCGYIVAASILFDIGVDLNNLTDLAWVLTGPAIASSISFSLAGSLSDIFGRRYVILTGEFIAIIGAIIAALAPNLQVLIAGTSILGLAAGLILVVYAAVPEILPNKYRSLGLLWVETTLAVPWTTIAFLLGNLLVLHATWRWVFRISIIYSVVSFAGTAAFYFPPSRPLQDKGVKRWQEVMNLDFVAILLFMGGALSFLLGLSWGGNPGHAWTSASVIAPIVIGVIAFSAAFIYDAFLIDQNKRRALFPRDLMSKYREFTLSLPVVFVAGMVYYAMAALLPEATELVFGAKPLEVGILLLPNGIGQTVGICLPPLFLHKTKHPTWYIIAAIVVQTLFTGLYAYGVTANKATWAAFQFFGAGCFGLITLTTVLNAGLHVRPSELGIAVGLLGTFRSVGGSVGNVIFNAILKSKVNEQLPKRIAEAALAAGFMDNLGALIAAATETGEGIPDAFASVDGITPAVESAAMVAFSAAYAQAFKMVFYATIPFGVVGIVCALFIKDSSKYMTNHTHVHLEKDVLHSAHRSVET